jgi:hypothetical protein
MNNLNTLAFCLILIFTTRNTMFSQTYIGPAVGYDFQKVISNKIFHLNLNSEGFGHCSPFIGINLKQKLFDQIYLQISSDITHKHVRGWPDGGAFQDLQFHYNYIKNHFILTYYWKNKWKIGGGATYNTVNNLYYENKENNFISNHKFNYSEQGVEFMLGLKYTMFEIEVFYQSRLTTPVEGDGIHTYHLHQIKSIGFRVSYDIKIFNGFNKKEKLECPPVNKMAAID